MAASLGVSYETFARREVSKQAENIVRICYQETASENKLIRLSMCCSKNTGTWIRERVIITCNYDL
jgi:hypothetical protein